MRSRRESLLSLGRALLAVSLVLAMGTPALARRDCRPNSRDHDHDGLSDCVEKRITGTDRRDADTDHDGISDSTELANGTDPLRADSDGDGLPDGDEILSGTDPTSPDTDGDGSWDGNDLDPHGDLTTQIRGLLEAVDPQGGTITLLGSVIDASSARFKAPVTLADLSVGMHVKVELDGAAAANGLLVAVEIEADDLDNDGQPNPYDEDDDGDGIPDNIDDHYDSPNDGGLDASDGQNDGNGDSLNDGNGDGNNLEDHDGDSPNSGSGPCLESKVEIRLSNVGPSPLAGGEAKSETEGDCNPEFSVEIKRLNPGTYNLIVGGTPRGTLTIWTSSHHGEAKIKFKATPQEIGEQPLTFDPSGSLIEIERDGIVYLTGVLP